jgi:hypothetical protein
LLLLKIEDADILQANATLIAGILIFLTIAPFSRDVLGQIIERKVILIIISGTMIAFFASTAVILFPAGSPEGNITGAKYLTAIGIGGIMFAMGVILEAIPGIRKTQRG